MWMQLISPQEMKPGAGSTRVLVTQILTQCCICKSISMVSCYISLPAIGVAAMKEWIELISLVFHGAYGTSLSRSRRRLYASRL
jgi:hypothetical protein